MDKDDVLILALGALEADELDMFHDGNGNMVFRKEQAIAAIKEALAQPAQPVGSWAPGNELTSIEKLGIAVSDFIGEHNLMWSDALVLAWQEAETDYVDELNNAINQGRGM
jgi:hypothetical protein